jgi:hypothetical protein
VANVSIATGSYGCKKPQLLQRQTSNGCNTLLQRDFLQPLATNAIWLQHLPFATKLGLFQRFFVVAQGLEVSNDWVLHASPGLPIYSPDDAL